MFLSYWTWGCERDKGEPDLFTFVPLEKGDRANGARGSVDFMVDHPLLISPYSLRKGEKNDVLRKGTTSVLISELTGQIP